MCFFFALPRAPTGVSGQENEGKYLVNQQWHWVSVALVRQMPFEKVGTVTKGVQSVDGLRRPSAVVSDYEGEFCLEYDDLHVMVAGPELIGGGKLYHGMSAVCRLPTTKLCKIRR